MHRETTAGVFLGERRVGTLTFADEITRFDYTDVEPGHPVLGQSFEDEPGRRRVTRIDVPAWFANLLPEAESPLRQMVATQYGLSAVRSFPLLLALGGDLSGAVEIRPDFDISSLVDPPGGWPHDSRSDRPRLAFSLAGVQLKFSMLREGRRFTLPMSGVGGQWIVKLPDRTFRDVPSNEHAMMRWAAAAGGDVPATELITGADVGLPDSLVAADEPVFAIRALTVLTIDGSMSRTSPRFERSLPGTSTTTAPTTGSVASFAPCPVTWVSRSTSVGWCSSWRWAMGMRTSRTGP